MMSILRSLESTSLSRKEIFAAIRMNGDTRAFRRYIKPLLEDEYIEMTAPDKPNSKLQKYSITGRGKAAIAEG
jgi:predicted transcriptional regulator